MDFSKVARGLGYDIKPAIGDGGSKRFLGMVVGGVS